MIPFFRKLRKRFADNNKPLKYIRYAIGEIILVVIGILIALSINNWNEERKQRNTIRSIYSIIKSDLKYDVEKFDEIINEMSIKDSIFQKVIDKRMTTEDYENCLECQFLLDGFVDVAIEKRGLKLLINKSTLFDSEKDSLLIEINNFYSYYDTEITVSQTEMSEDFQDNWFYWKNNKPWFSDYFNLIKNDETILYMLNSWDYRNRVSAAYILQYQIYLRQLKEYKKDALMIIDDINKRLHS